MKILFLTAFPPNKKTAGQNYTRQLLNDLSNSHRIDLIYWDYPNHDIDVSSSIKILKKVKYASIISQILTNLDFFPLFSRRFDKSILKYIKSISHQYDCIYFDFSQIMLYSAFIDHPYKLGMSHDVIAQKYSRHKYARYLSKWILKTEHLCLKSLNKVFTFSNKDANYIREHYSITPEVVSFYISKEISQIKLSEICIEDYLVLYGAWNRPENQYTLRWLIDNSIANKVKIIGGGIPEELKVKLESNRHIECLGFVDNPYPIIAKSKGLIAPLQNGAGVKVKAIESLSLGTPVIGTDITFEGIELPLSLKNRVFFDIDSTPLTDILNVLNHISIQDKIINQKEFLNNYGNKKVSNFLCKNN